MKKGVITVLMMMLYWCAGAQEVWPKLIKFDYSFFVKMGRGHYDSSMVILGHNQKNYSHSNSKLIKLDANGEQVWVKTLKGDKGSYLRACRFRITDDRGFIICGSTHEIAPAGDGFIMKLDACGQKEWCTIITFNHPMWNSWFDDVVQTPDGGYAVLWGQIDLQDKRACVARFSSEGDLLWTCIVPHEQWYNLSSNETMRNLEVMPDGNLLVSGESYFCNDPVNPTNFPLKPVWAMLSEEGEVLWYRAFGDYEESIKGQCALSYPQDDGTFISLGPRINVLSGDDYIPFICQVDSDGDTLWSGLIQGPYNSGSHECFLQQGNLFYFAPGYSNKENKKGYYYLYKTSKTLEVEDSLLVTVSDYRAVTKILEWTYDKHLITGNILLDAQDKIKSHIMKLDTNFHVAAWDPTPIVYDYMCDTPILNDTILVTGKIITGIKEAPTGRKATLTIAPNPVLSELHILLPGTVEIAGAGGMITRYHQYAGVLEVVNLNGQTVISSPVERGMSSYTTPAAALKPGMYLVRLIVKNHVVASGKFIRQ